MLRRALWPALAVLSAASCTRPLGWVFDGDGGNEPDGGFWDVPQVCTAAGGGQPGAPWPFFRGDTRQTGASEQLGPAQGEVAWFYDVGSGGIGFVWSSPVVDSHGVVYAARWEDEDLWGWLYAVHADGSLAWSRHLLHGNIVWGSPALARDGSILIAYGGHDFGDPPAGLSAFAPDGTLRWSIGLGAFITSSPVIDDQGGIYISADTTYHNLQDRQGRLYALTPGGAIRWQVDLPDYPDGAPALAGDCTVYVGTCSELLAVDQGGSVRWRLDTGEPLGCAAPYHCTPVVARDGTIYYSAGSGSLLAVSPAGGERWRLTPEGSDLEYTLPALGPDGGIFVVASTYSEPSVLQAITADGEVRWTYPLRSFTGSSPVVGGDGTIYVATDDGTVEALGPDGSVLWTMALPTHVGSSSLALANGRLYVASFTDGDPSLQQGIYAIGP